MKNKFTYRTLFGVLILSIAIFYSACKKSSSSGTDSDDTKYSELKNWYNNEKAKSSVVDNPLSGLKPNWEKIIARQDSTKIIYEVETKKCILKKQEHSLGKSSIMEYLESI